MASLPPWPEDGESFLISFRLRHVAVAEALACVARLLLEKKLPADVDLLKVDVPSSATPETPWQITRLAPQHYFQPTPAKRLSWDEPGRMSYEFKPDLTCAADTDVHVLLIKRHVSVTPLSLDNTSRVSFPDLDNLLRSPQ